MPNHSGGVLFRAMSDTELSHVRTELKLRRILRAIPNRQAQVAASPLRVATEVLIPNRYCSPAYSDLASFRMGMSGSASFHRVRNSL